MTSCSTERRNGVGNLLPKLLIPLDREFCKINPNDPGWTPRNQSLKTRIGKKELAATAKSICAVSSLEPVTPLKRLTSRSMLTLPVSAIIFWTVPLETFALFSFDWPAWFPELLPRRRTRGSIKAVSVSLDIVADSFRLAKAVQWSVKHFSHALAVEATEKF
jgi:hypothetical protein